LEGHNVTHPFLLLLLVVVVEMLLEHENTKSACRKSVSHVLCLLLAFFVLSHGSKGGFCMLPSSFQETTFQLIARHHCPTLSLNLPEGFIIITIIIIIT
jgi:hypothetical protein